MRRLKDCRGFTLVEMLIVVAIAAILIAVSIPLVGSALDKARHATDAANERAARAAASIHYLTGEIEKDSPNSGASHIIYLYNAPGGKLERANATEMAKCPAYGQCGKDGHEGASVYVRLNRFDGTIELCWMPKGTTSGSSGFDWGGGLCSAKLN